MAESSALRVAGLRLVVEGASQFQDELRATSQEIKLSQVELEKLNAVYGKSDQSAEKLAKKQAELNRQLDAQTKRIQTLKNARDAYAQKENASKSTIDKLTLAISKEELAQIQLQTQLKQTTDEIAAQEAATAAAAAAQQEAEAAAVAQQEAQKAAAQATDQATASAENQRSTLMRLKDGLRQAAKDADAFADKYIKAGEKISKAGGKITRTVTAPLVAGLTFAAKEAIDFENAFADVEKTVNATDSEIANLRNDVLGLSRALPQTKEEISAVAALGGQFKVPIENLDEYAKVMLDMGVATSLGATTAAEGMAQFAGIVQMNQADYERLGSTIVALGNNMRTQEGPIMEMGLRLAAAGNQAGMSEAKIMGISAALASLGIEAEVGGSAMSKVILNMDMAVAKGGKSLSAYSKIAGMTAKEFKAQWDTDAAGGLTKFIAGLQKIDQAGGNVALTLENLGYKEVRTRDALLRAVGAGDMFADALNLANQAWAENNALATEAAKKNATFANRLKILGNNVGLTAQRFGETLMPTLEGGFEYASGLVDKFGELDERQRAMILTTVGLVAAVGPAVKIIGNMTQAVGYLGKAFGFLAGPQGWIGIAAIGLGALAYLMATTKTKAQEMDAALKGIVITVDPASKAAITGAINVGIEAANAVHDVKVQATVDASALQANIDAALADRDITKREFTAISKFVNEKVSKDIDDAKAALVIKVEEYKKVLDSMTDAQGKALTDEEKDVMLADFEAKNGQLIVDLAAEKQNLIALLAMLQSQTSPITDAQIAQLDTQLAKIANIREELRIASDEVAAAGLTNYALTVSGQGNEQSAGAAVGYVQQEQALAIAAAEKQRQDALAAAGQDLELGKKAWDDYNTSVAAANATAQGKYQEILDGVAQMAGAETILKTLAQDYDALKAAMSFDDLYLTTLNFAAKKKEWLSLLSSAFGEGGSLRDYLPDDQKIKIDDLIAIGGGTHLDYRYVKGIVEDLQKQLGDALVLNAQDPTLNPLNAILSSMLDSGAINAIDPTTVSGAMEGLFKLYDAKARGNQIGGDIVAGVPAGIGEAAENLPPESFDKLKDAVLKNLQTAFDSHSPARVTMPVGADVVGGVAAGMSQNKDAVKAAAEELPGVAKDGLQGMPGVGLSAGQGMMAQLLQGLRNGKPSVLAEAQQIAATIRQMLSDAYSYRPSGGNFDYSLGNGETYTTEEVNAKSGQQSDARASTSSTVQYVDNSPPMVIQNAYINKESDAYALAAAADSLRRRRLAGVGTVPG